MLDFSRFDVLTFDCYGTLIDWEMGILQCLHDILAAYGKDTDNARILQLYGDFEAAAEAGEYCSYRHVLQSVIRQFGGKLQFEPSHQEIRSLEDSLPSWKPWPDTVEALRELQNRFRLAIISNIDDDLFAATRSQIGVEFSHVVTAQQARAYKPASSIFELALSRIGVSAQHILHVGQSLYHDVIPARSLGFGTVWVNRPSARAGIGAVKKAEGEPDLQVSSLAELAAACVRPETLRN